MGFTCQNIIIPVLLSHLVWLNIMLSQATQTLLPGRCDRCENKKRRQPVPARQCGYVTSGNMEAGNGRDNAEIIVVAFVASLKQNNVVRLYYL